jgi:MATE family multidrug resistance protein
MTRIWLVTAAWITIRAAFGLLRIWPGIGAAPLRRPGQP